MRIFLSWSGDRSKAAALGLKSLLESTFPDAVDVFISDHIDAGDTWARTTRKRAGAVSIWCSVPDAGQLSSALAAIRGRGHREKFGSTRVVPYLIDDLPAAADRSPLAQFQHVKASREGTLRLVKSINAVRENPQINEQKLETLFKGWWRDFEDTLNALPVSAGKQPNPRSDRELLGDDSTEDRYSRQVASWFDRIAR